MRLYVTDPLHISLPLYSFLQTAGPYVYASDISAASAIVNVEVPVENSRSINRGGVDSDFPEDLNHRHVEGLPPDDAPEFI